MLRKCFKAPRSLSCARRSFTTSASARLSSPPSERNAKPIYTHLLPLLKEALATKPKRDLVSVVNLSDGSGYHTATWSRWIEEDTSVSDEDVARLRWQPTERGDPELASIASYGEHCQNVLAPLQVDLSSEATTWGIPAASVDVCLNVNVIHVAPWPSVCKGLVTGVARMLKQGCPFLLYGAFSVNGQITPESNVRFNEWLGDTYAGGGIRAMEDVVSMAHRAGLTCVSKHEVPANNWVLLFRKD